MLLAFNVLPVKSKLRMLHCCCFLSQAKIGQCWALIASEGGLQSLIRYPNKDKVSCKS